MRLSQFILLGLALCVCLSDCIGMTHNQIIDALGGVTAISRLTEVPVSTIHSWRKIGIPNSRMQHLKLAAAAAGLVVDFDATPAA